MRAHVRRLGPNQAMQLTASRPAIYLLRVCHPRSWFHRSSQGLAADDLGLVRPLNTYGKSMHHQSVLRRTPDCFHRSGSCSEHLFPKRVDPVWLACRSRSVLPHLLCLRALQHCRLCSVVQTLGEARRQVRRQEAARQMTTTRPNHALQRTRHERRGCNRCVPRAGSLSLGR